MPKRPLQFVQYVIIPLFAFLVGLGTELLLSVLTVDDLIINPFTFVFAGLSILLISLSGIFIYFLRQIREKDEQVKFYLKDIRNIVGQKAELIEFEEAYRRLRKWIIEAEKEILIINAVYKGSDGNYAPFDKSRSENERRAEMYEALIEKVNNARETGITIKRLYQFETTPVKAKPSFEEIASYFTKRDEEISSTNYRLAQAMIDAGKECGPVEIRATSIFMHTTFVLIDKKYFFQHIETWSEDFQEFKAPFDLIAESPESEYFSELENIFLLLFKKERSVPITHKHLEMAISRLETNTPDEPQSTTDTGSESSNL